MTQLTNLLALKLGSLFEELGLDFELGVVVRAQKAEFGQYQCNGAMVGAKLIGKNPREIAVSIAGRLVMDPVIAKCEVAGLGYVGRGLGE